MKRAGPLLLLTLAGCPAAVAGCSTGKLESGYAYRPLNSSTVERRAFYADPYSLDARRAEAERAQDQSPSPGGRRGAGVRPRR